MPSGQPIILHPPAKINLFLDVGSLRADGFHDLVSILQSIEIRDRLLIQPSTSGQFSLSVKGSSVPDGPDNTLWKTFQLFREIQPEVPSIQASLEKKIPSQAGLGGGSSDAGVFLRFLWETYAPQIPRSAMVALAASVGSDVPFFLDGGTCLVEGRGERVTPLPGLPPRPVLIVHPGVSVSTADAFRALDATRNREHPPVEPVQSAIEKGEWKLVLRALHNSFHEAVFPAHPLLAEIHAFCLNQGFPACLLSGSGSNLFVFGSSDLNHLARKVREHFPGVATTLTQTAEGL